MRKINRRIFIMTMMLQVSYVLFGSALQDVPLVNTHPYLSRATIDIPRMAFLPIGDQIELQRLNKEHKYYDDVYSQEYALYRLFHDQCERASDQKIKLQLSQDVRKQEQKTYKMYNFLTKFMDLNAARYNRILSGKPETLIDAKNNWKMIKLDSELQKLIHQK